MSSFCQLHQCWEKQAFVSPHAISRPSWKPSPGGIGNSFSYIYDHVHSVYQHIDKSIYRILGYAPEDVMCEGLRFLDQVMHPSEHEPVMKLMLRAWQLILDQPPAFRKEYNMNIDYRLRHAEGRWVHLIQQNHVLSTDDIGNIVYSAGICYDISHWQKTSPPTLSLYHQNTLIGRWKAEPPIVVNAISRREKEVVREVCKGKTSGEIADELCISKHTVDTHRKTIMRKLGLKGTPALVQFAHQYQLI